MEQFDSECRICLNDGDIPIFGTEGDTIIAAEIMMFGGIEINKDDRFPRNICNNCFTLLKSAIKFRNTAQQTNKILKSLRVFNKENCENSNNSTLVKDHPNDITSNSSSINTSNENGNVNEHELVMLIVSENADQQVDKTVIIRQDTEEFACDVCIMDFESLTDYNQHKKTKYHIKTQKRANKTPCQICEKLVVTSKYERHIEKHNSEELQRLIFECHLCSVQFDTVKEFESHNSEHQESFKYSDSSIDEFEATSSKSQDNLNYSDSSKELPRVECKICKKNISKSYFKIHLKIHGSDQERAERQRTCPFCDKHVSYSYFKDHIRRKHSIEEKKDKKQKSDTFDTMFICDKCGKVFKRKYALEVHVLTHGSELKFKCMFCPYRGLHQDLLKTHIRTHTGDYNYKCTKCPGRFLTKSNLSKHLKRHTGPVDFKCDSCGRGFYSQLELDRHYSVQHLGIKSHICNICGKAFGYRNGMMSHQLKVHKRKKLTEGKGRLPNYLQSKVNNSE